MSKQVKQQSTNYHENVKKGLDYLKGSDRIVGDIINYCVNEYKQSPTPKSIGIVQKYLQDTADSVSDHVLTIAHNISKMLEQQVREIELLNYDTQFISHRLNISESYMSSLMMTKFQTYPRPRKTIHILRKTLPDEQLPKSARRRGAWKRQKEFNYKLLDKVGKNVVSTGTENSNNQSTKQTTIYHTKRSSQSMTLSNIGISVGSQNPPPPTFSSYQSSSNVMKNTNENNNNNNNNNNNSNNKSTGEGESPPNPPNPPKQMQKQISNPPPDPPKPPNVPQNNGPPQPPNPPNPPNPPKPPNPPNNTQSPPQPPNPPNPPNPPKPPSPPNQNNGPPQPPKPPSPPNMGGPPPVPKTGGPPPVPKVGGPPPVPNMGGPPPVPNVGGPPPVPQNNNNNNECPEEFQPYIKMLKMGVPRVAVNGKMQREGYDPSELDPYV